VADSQTPGDEGSSALFAAYEASLVRLQEDPTLSGVDLGYAWIDGRRTDRIVVRVHVRGGELPEMELAERVGDALHRSTVFVLRADYRRRVPLVADGEMTTLVYHSPANPIRPGVSVSHESTSGGTLGLVVFLKDTGRACALSNAHVLAPATATQNGWAIQPGRNWGGTASKPTNLIGRLYESFSDIDGDAAIAALETHRGIELAQLASNTVVTSAQYARLGDRAEKIGVATGRTCGFVDGIGRYRLSDSPGTLMDGFRIVPGSSGEPCDSEVSSEGDSGAVWYRPEDAAGIGLHVGGDISIGDHRRQPAIACHLPRVLDRLNVTIGAAAE
jgi:endonuclease G, mitochondrial